MGSKRGIRVALALLPSFFAGAAPGDGTPASAGPERPAREDRRPFEPMDAGWLVAAEDPAMEVIRDADAWKVFVDRRRSRSVSKEKVPPVDFSKEMVIAVFLGERPTAGYAVAVTKIVETEEALTVHVLEMRPRREDAVLQVLTYPSFLARTARSDKPVRFRQSRDPEPAGKPVAEPEVPR